MDTKTPYEKAIEDTPEIILTPEQAEAVVDDISRIVEMFEDYEDVGQRISILAWNIARQPSLDGCVKFAERIINRAFSHSIAQEVAHEAFVLEGRKALNE